MGLSAQTEGCNGLHPSLMLQESDSASWAPFREPGLRSLATPTGSGLAAEDAALAPSTVAATATGSPPATRPTESNCFFFKALWGNSGAWVGLEQPSQVYGDQVASEGCPGISTELQLRSQCPDHSSHKTNSKNESL